MPPLAVQVIRAKNREIAMKFMDVDDEDSWEYSLLEGEIAFDFNDMYREIQSTV